MDQSLSLIANSKAEILMLIETCISSISSNTYNVILISENSNSISFNPIYTLNFNGFHRSYCNLIIFAAAVFPAAVNRARYVPLGHNAVEITSSLNRNFINRRLPVASNTSIDAG